MKIVSYNVNGIRAAMKKGLLTWFKESEADILCIQETKAQPEQVDLSELEEAGIHGHWHNAVKKGYSGVLTLSKEKPLEVSTGIGVEKFDSEGRTVLTVFKDFALINCYFPSGSASEERHSFKMDFLNDIRPWTEKLLKKHPKLIVLGDYNVVHLDLDIHNPKRKDSPSGFRPEERKWMDEWFSDLFVDAYRHKHPDQADMYSWWSYRAGSRGKNKGWRIDYIAVSNAMSDAIIDAGHHTDAVHSDHCPIWVKLNL